MSRKLRFFLAVGILLLIVSIGFNIAFALPGAPEPGSDQDPLISKSYVDQSVGLLNQSILNLKNQLDQLKQSNESLTQKLAAQDAVVKSLQDELKNVKTQTPGTTTNPPAATTSLKGTITASILNVRSQANTTSSVVAKVVKGESVTIVTKGTEWHKIKTSRGVTGYVLGKYVSIK